MGALAPRYWFLLNRHAGARFTKCPRCEAQTRLRKLALVVHVERPDGPRLAVLGKTCRLCAVCEMLIVDQADLERLIAASGLCREARKAGYLVLGTVGLGVWRRGLAGDVSLGDVRQQMADFNAYMDVDFTPGGWYPKSEALANKRLKPTARAKRRRRG